MDFFWHKHTLSVIVDGCCIECDTHLEDTILKYECDECVLKWHTCCVPNSPENFNHSCHPSHPLELLCQGPPNYSDGICSLCPRKLKNFVYHCKLCDFSVHVKCARLPPPLTVNHPKCHDHALTLMGREVSFTCNACGTHGERNPYVCLPCSLMFHYDCIGLPHVININRHEHRVSHAHPLSPGDRTCEICRQDINWRYGAYSCTKCPDFSVHSRCAIRKDVWDGVELEGLPEEEVETAPFKVIDEGIINHFSHEEHNLFLIEDVIIEGGEGISCVGCSRPISFERYYNCMECDFMLHEECANLPLQKRHALSTRIFSLSTGKENAFMFFSCHACDRIGTGFRYQDNVDDIRRVVLDVHCASLSWFRHRKLHPHTLFITTLDKRDCVGCEKTGDKAQLRYSTSSDKAQLRYGLGCVECEYFLDFKCATLPVVIKHRCDDHYLFLSSGEMATGKYWCEICEAETNPEKWFYTCHDCGVVCHIDCVIGDSLNSKPGVLCNEETTKIEMVLNDKNTRPRCSGCGSRCRFPLYLIISTENMDNLYCSIDCIAEDNDPKKNNFN